MQKVNIQLQEQKYIINITKDIDSKGGGLIPK